MARRRRFRRRIVRRRAAPRRRRRGRRRSRLRRFARGQKSTFQQLGNAVSALVFFSQLTQKDRDAGLYAGQSMGQKAKTFTDNVLGRIVGVNPFGGNFPQTINIDGAANKYTGAGIAALIYGMLPIRALPHKGKAKSLGKKIAVAGILGGIFDAPENDTRNRVQAQRPSIVPNRAFSTGRQMTTT